jgi:hypothetical protein
MTLEGIGDMSSYQINKRFTFKIHIFSQFFLYCFLFLCHYLYCFILSGINECV